MISVLCPPDKHLHLAPEDGCSASSYTLCLLKWKDRAACYADSEFCPECFDKWREKGEQHQ